MGWTAYKLIYQTKSPIHIGWYTLGYIKLTRYYITGKSMWGAMTANIVRTCYEYSDYTDIGNILCDNILISYFYPAINRNNHIQILIPQFSIDGLKYGEFKEYDFERKFISSYGQTSVDPENNTAEDESLHESEYIVSMISENEPVYFVGYIFISDEAKFNDCKINFINIKDAISEIFIGGDRKYGWGRLNLLNATPAPDMFGFNIENFPEIKIPLNGTIPAHLIINDALKLKGDIEPIIGREYGEVQDNGNKYIGFGQKISNAEICWIPVTIRRRSKYEIWEIWNFNENLKREEYDLKDIIKQTIAGLIVAVICGQVSLKTGISSSYSLIISLMVVIISLIIIFLYNWKQYSIFRIVSKFKIFKSGAQGYYSDFSPNDSIQIWQEANNKVSYFGTTSNSIINELIIFMNSEQGKKLKYEFLLMNPDIRSLLKNRK